MQEENKEVVVASLSTGEVATAQEQEMGQEISVVEQQANAIVIKSNEDYESAAAFGRFIKQKSSQVIDFFAPMKKAAHDAHANICAREKIMLAPLVSAEKTVKKIMGDFVMEQERRKREEEERLRRIAQEEADRKLAEAMDCESNGDKDGAEAALMEADIVDSASRNIVIETQKPKAAGVATATDWEIESIDESQVPISIQGMCIRPVDAKMVVRLIKMSKGTIQIPGIKYKAVAKLSFRK